MVKDTDEKPAEEIQRTRSGKVPSTGVSVPIGLGCVTSQFILLKALLIPYH